MNKFAILELTMDQKQSRRCHQMKVLEVMKYYRERRISLFICMFCFILFLVIILKMI